MVRSSIALVISVGAVFVGCHKPEKPHLRIEVTHASLGRIVQGAKAKSSFAVTNTGGGVLSVQGLSPGCQCTTATVSAQSLRHGENASVDVVVDSGLKAGGLLNESLSFTTNDESQPLVILTLSGTVVREFDVSPSIVDLGIKARSDEAKGSVIIATTDESDAKVVGVVSDDPLMHVSITTGARGGRPVSTVVASYDSSVGSGWHRASLIISTTSDFTPTIRIPVRLLVSSVSDHR